MKLEARTAAVAVTLAALAGLTWWMSRSAQAPILPLHKPPQHEPDYIIERFNGVSLLQNGNRKYTLAATKLTHYADDGSSELEQPYLVQFGEGAPVHTRAQRGWMPRDNSHILMSGHVRVARGRDPKSAGGEIVTESMKVILNK